MHWTLRTANDWLAFARTMQAIDREQVWEATVKPYEKRRSVRQSRLLHSWLQTLGNHCGYSLDEMKSLMKEQFLPPKMVTFRGMNRLIYPSTADLKSAEMDDFMSKVQAFAATELQITLPSTLGE